MCGGPAASCEKLGLCLALQQVWHVRQQHGVWYNAARAVNEVHAASANVGVHAPLLASG